MKGNLKILVIFALSMGIGFASSTSTLNSVSASSVPVTGGLCPEGHDCICNPGSGVFSDLTTGSRVNSDCGQEVGEVTVPGGQGLCPEGHDCICIPASGVFSDLTTGDRLNNGCTGSSG